MGWKRSTLSLLANERLVDVGDDTTTSDGSLDQRVQLLVPSDGELQMPGGDPLDLQVLGCVASQLQHLSSQVLQDSRAVYSSGGSNTTRREGTTLQVTMNPEIYSKIIKNKEKIPPIPHWADDKYHRKAGWGRVSIIFQNLVGICLTWIINIILFYHFYGILVNTSFCSNEDLDLVKDLFFIQKNVLAIYSLNFGSCNGQLSWLSFHSGYCPYYNAFIFQL